MRAYYHVCALEDVHAYVHTSLALCLDTSMLRQPSKPTNLSLYNLVNNSSFSAKTDILQVAQSCILRILSLVPLPQVAFPVDGLYGFNKQ